MTDHKNESAYFKLKCRNRDKRSTYPPRRKEKKHIFNQENKGKRHFFGVKQQENFTSNDWKKVKFSVHPKEDRAKVSTKSEKRKKPNELGMF